MKKAEEDTLNTAFETFVRLMISEGPVEQLSEYATPDVMGYGTTIDEVIKDLTVLKNLTQLQREHTSDENFHYNSTPVFRRVMNHAKTAVFVDEVQLNFVFDGKPLSFQIRLSVIMELIEGKWKAIHFHASKPDYDSGGVDPWHKDEWKKKNEELQQLVENKTADLEKKNRDLEVEATLERVRAQSMMMKHSDELNKTCQVFHEQLQVLGIDSDFSYLWLPDELKKEHLFLATWKHESQGESSYMNSRVSYPLDKSEPDIAECYLAWESGLPVHVNKVPAEGVENYFNNWDALFQNEERFQPKYYPEGLYYVDAYMKYGCFGIMTLHKLSMEEEQILYRFSMEFERAYTRFLDLKNAESQTREAQIEAALERVRSMSMGMRKSEELGDLSFELVKQVHKLGIDTWFCAFNIYDDHPEGSLEWGSNAQGTYEAYRTPREGIFKQYYEAGVKGESLLINELDETACPAHYDYLCSLPGVGEQLLAMKDARIPFPTSQIDHVAYFKYGYIIFITFDPVAQDHGVFKRFAKVFEQTYTRFLDLKRAEEQTRDAVKQASLDRIRGEIASMRNAEDLNRIIPVIWRELQALEVPFIRCGVFIMDENRQRIQTYLSTPEGHALSAFELEFDAAGIAKGAVNHWRKNQIYKDFWNKDQFLAFMKKLIEEEKIDDPKTFQGNTEAPESLYLHFVPFRQGMLYVGDLSAMPNAKIDLVRTLADAFSIAYARYEDFKNLEIAKNKIEFTLSELKATQAQLIQSEKMASLGELTAGIAHEIQNPLNFVNNFSELSSELLGEMEAELKAGDIGEAIEIASDINQNLKKINHHGKRAESIVKSMLLHSRSNTGQKELTDINALADEYLRLSFHGFRAKDKSFNADFNLNLDETLPKLSLIPQDIGRVLLNLINNAFYAVAEKAKKDRINSQSADSGYKPLVSVATKIIEDKIEISVEDNGDGIPEHIRDKIFQPFFTTKPTGEGTGLGLSLSYDIITKGHNGELQVESKKGKGTKFKIILAI